MHPHSTTPCLVQPHSTTREIPLTRGYVALVDNEDYERIAVHRWQVNFSNRPGRGRLLYANRHTTVEGVKESFFMHRVILGPKRGEVVHHVNGDGLDNRRANLRFCTTAINVAGGEWRRGLSGYRGVSLDHGKWAAQISYQGKTVHIGRFSGSVEAALAYDQVCLELRGEFAVLNFDTLGVAAAAIRLQEWQAEDAAREGGGDEC